MQTSTRRTFLGSIAAAGAITLMTSPAQADGKIFSSFFGNVAIEGYDPVAYFKAKKPVKGQKKFQTKWKGANWHFANAANLDAFKASPEKFAPQYGGYCAWAVSQGYTAKIDPSAWKVVNGKLYLNYSAGVQATWSKDIPGNISKADTNWPGIEAKL